MRKGTNTAQPITASKLTLRQPASISRFSHKMFAGGFATQEQTNLSSFTGSNQPLASKFGSPFGSNPIGNSKFGSTAHSTSSTGKFSGLNQNITQDSQGRYYGPNVCRMCGKQFPSAPELKLHIKSEGHFDTANAAAPSAPHAADPLGNNFSHQPRQPYTHEFKSSAGHSSQASKPSVPVMHMDELPSKQSMSTRLSAESLSDLGRRRKEFIPHSTSESIMSDGSTSNHDSNMKDQAMDETAEREKSLRELLRNKLKNNKEDNKVNPVKAESAISVVSKSKPLPKISNPIRSKTIHHDNDPLDFDRGRRPDVSYINIYHDNMLYYLMNDRDVPCARICVPRKKESEGAQNTGLCMI